MAKSKRAGFRYYVSDDKIERYRKKPVALRLQWLYMANVLRKGCSKRIIAIQDSFRHGKRTSISRFSQFGKMRSSR